MVKPLPGGIAILRDVGSWVPNPDNIDLDSFTGFGVDYITIKTERWDDDFKPDINLRQLPRGGSTSSKFGRKEIVVTFRGFVESLDLQNKVHAFLNDHLYISDPQLYLVIKHETDLSTYYVKWKDKSRISRSYLPVEFTGVKRGFKTPDFNFWLIGGTCESNW